MLAASDVKGETLIVAGFGNGHSERVGRRWIEITRTKITNGI